MPSCVLMQVSISKSKSNFEQIFAAATTELESNKIYFSRWCHTSWFCTMMYIPPALSFFCFWAFTWSSCDLIFANITSCRLLRWLFRFVGFFPAMSIPHGFFDFSSTTVHWLLRQWIFLVLVFLAIFVLVFIKFLNENFRSYSVFPPQNYDRCSFRSR